MTHDMAALMHADPAFAAGGGSFSSGLERLAADGWVATSDDLLARMVEAVTARWDPFDRVYLVRAFGMPPQERLALDLDLEASTLGHEARSASRRAGTALLATWARLGLTVAAEYREAVRSHPGAGHLAVAQAVVFDARGLSIRDAESLSCWAVLSGFASSAVRLGVIGHVGAQTALLEAHVAVAGMLEKTVSAGAEPWTFTPLHDIAIERHSLSDMKLFAS